MANKEVHDLNDVQQLLDMLYAMIDDARNAALSNDKCVINRDEALDLLEEARAKLPAELKQAQRIITSREEYIETAKNEVEKMMQRAEAAAKSKISESEVVQAAREKAREIISRAEERARDMYRAANEYAEDTLRRGEEALQQAAKEMQESRTRFRAASAEQMQRNREELDRQAKEKKTKF